jgi:hypothetical protein
MSAGAAELTRGPVETVKLFYGFDPREAVGAHVFLQSVLQNTSSPVEAIALTPQIGKAMGIESEGTNSFGKLRFAIPALCDYKGYAIFMDGADQLLRADIAELWALRNGWEAVQVVKHEYSTRFPRKYVGTDLEADNKDYERKNWSSVVIWNCAHYMNQVLTPGYVAKQSSQFLHRFQWLPDERIGDLPAEWNVLISEQLSGLSTKVAHFTCGGPFFTHYANADHANEWRAAYVQSQRGMQYSLTEPSER